MEHINNQTFTIKERLKLFISFLGISTRKFEIDCGLPNAYVNNIRNSVTEDKLQNILERYPQLNKTWLVFGEGDMVLKKNSKTCESSEECTTEVISETPVIPENIIMKPDTDISEYVNKNSKEIEKLTLSHIFPPRDLFYRVISDGMRPQVEKGDILALKRIPNKTKIMDGECYLLNTVNHGFLLRRLHFKDGIFTCESNLQELGIMEISEEDVFNVYSIVGLLRLRVTPHAEEVMLRTANERKGKVIEEMLTQHTTMLDIISNMTKK